jgi:hypothetical protein
VRGPFEALQELADVVQAETGEQAAEVAGLDSERCPRLRWSGPQKTASKAVVDRLAERLAGAPHLGPQLGRNVIIQGKRGPHITMLRARHQDVKARTAGQRAKTAPV